MKRVIVAIFLLVPAPAFATNLEELREKIQLLEEELVAIRGLFRAADVSMTLPDGTVVNFNDVSLEKKMAFFNAVNTQITEVQTACDDIPDSITP